MNKQAYTDLNSYLSTGEIPENSEIFHKGFGSLKALLFDPSESESWPEYLKKFKPEVEDFYNAILDHRPQDVRRITQSIKQSLLTSFFTPDPIVKAILDVISVFNPKNILEPSAGTGNFINYFPSYYRTTAIEKDFLTHEILSKKFPGIQAYNQGFEDFTEKGFDLVISNIPFGDFKVYDHDFYLSKNKAKIQSTTRIHNYYFVKSLDLLKEGGIIAFLVTSNFLDTKSNLSTREYIQQNAKLLGSVRIPYNVFESTGTKPTCDIIILQKIKGGSKQNPFLESQTIEFENTQFPINEFYLSHPEYILGDFEQSGQYRNELAIASNDDSTTIAEQVTKSLQKQISENNKTSEKPDTQIEKFDLKIRPKKELSQHFKPGNLFIQDQKVYRINQDDIGYFLESKKLDVDQTAALINLRIIYQILLNEEQSENKESADNLRKQLNEIYNLVRFRFGPLNGRLNKQVLSSEIDAHILYGLEVQNGNQWDQSDIFDRQVTNAAQVVESPKSLNDAIIISLRAHNKIVPESITNLLGISYDQLVIQAVKEDLLYLNPEDQKWELVTKAEFTSGHIQNKIDALDSFPDQFSDLKDLHHQLLVENLPEWIPFELIDINLGERWIPISVWKNFLEDFFRTEKYNEVRVQIVYSKSIDKFSIEVQDYSPVNHSEFAVTSKKSGRTITGQRLMEHAFADTSPTITYTVSSEGKQTTLVDHEATRLAQDRIESIFHKFQQWLLSQPETKTTIEEQYNIRFNSIVPRYYDGSHQDFQDLEFFKPYPSQKNAVYRNLCQNGGINDHLVGAGKSLVMAITCHEMKRLKIINKPMIICMNANVTSIYKEYKKAFPNDKVLHPEAKHFRPAHRPQLFHQMMNNEYDCIIISHDQFKMIPQSLEMEIQIMEEEMDNIDQDLKVLLKENQTHMTTKLAKGLEKRKNNLASKISELRNNIKRDDRLPDFDKMGIDHLFIDESQEFKNLMYTTRHKQVSGLGTPQGSQRAYNLLIACRTLQKRYNADKGITFLSGTTISNSLVELYLLFKYLRPNELRRLDIHSFDAWAKVYARKSSEFEFSVTNEVKRKERFREFIKVPELAKFYTEITDVVNEKNFKIERPTLKNQLVNIPPTPYQEEFTQKLIQFAKTKQGHHIGISLSEDEKTAFMLIATNYAKKASLDMRIIDPIAYPNPKGSKVFIAAEQLSKIYHQFNDILGTQLVFCDLSTPSKQFNVYNELKHRLFTHYQIPAEEIAFIHDAKSTKQRQELFRKVNEGIIRILIGSTTKMGVGVNVQKKVVAMHHLDIPWRPSDMEQRNGRGARQGNEAAIKNNNTVLNFIYAVEKSLDSYQFNLLQNKSKFIRQIKDGSIKLRRIDEGSMSGEGSEQQMNFAEYVALLSGNQSLLQKAKLDKKIRDIEMLYAAHISEQTSSKNWLKIWEEDLQIDQDHIQKYDRDILLANELNDNPDPITKDKKRFYYPKPVIIRDQALYDTEKIGELLIQMVTAFQKDENTFDPIAKYGPFTLQLNSRFEPILIGEMRYNFYGEISNNPVDAGKFIINTLERIPSTKKKTLQDIERTKLLIEEAKNKLNEKFTKLNELDQLKEERDKVIAEMQAIEDEKNEKEAAENEPTIDESPQPPVINETLTTVEQVIASSYAVGNIIKLPSQQLPRELYLETKKKFEAIGGSWKGGHTSGFLFPHNPSPLLKELQQGKEINLKKDYQFFPTPKELADVLASLADLRSEHSILEPSAGHGALIHSINRILPNKPVDCYELMPQNQEVLNSIPTANLIGDDFLNNHDDHLLYDRIIANPPFSKNQDIVHIRKMYDKLKPGGKMVAISSIHWQISNNSKEKEFSHWIDTVKGRVEELPEGAFTMSGTNVRTLLICIDKPRF